MLNTLISAQFINFLMTQIPDIEEIKIIGLTEWTVLEQNYSCKGYRGN